ncbi:MAG: uroporphyrinogen decarboxylase family protein, partial [Conexivisphaerales archaeon]
MNSVLTDALNGREHSGIPVWYMRQAGRHMPGFAKYLSQDSLPNIIRNPEKSSEIAIEAVDKLGVDAAIMFSDIVTPLEAAGL